MAVGLLQAERAGRAIERQVCTQAGPSRDKEPAVWPSELNNGVGQSHWAWVHTTAQTAGDEWAVMKDQECCAVGGRYRAPGLPRLFLSSACCPGLIAVYLTSLLDS